MGAIVTASEPYLLLGWAASRLGFKTVWPPESVPLASVDPDTGEIHAVVIYNAFYDSSCMMHIASAKTRRWATRTTLDQFFRYAFVTRGLSRVATQVSQGNVPAQVLALKLGFKFEGVTRYQGVTMIHGGQVVADTITADKMDVDELSAITAKIGTVESENYAEDGAGIPTAGFKLDGPNDQIKGKEVITPRLISGGFIVHRQRDEKSNFRVNSNTDVLTIPVADEDDDGITVKMYFHVTPDGSKSGEADWSLIVETSDYFSLSSVLANGSFVFDAPFPADYSGREFTAMEYSGRRVNSTDNVILKFSNVVGSFYFDGHILIERAVTEI